MELTDEQINGLRRVFLDGDWTDTESKRQINALCDMALAHNAARKAEPVAWQVLNSDGKIVATRTDKHNAVMFYRYGEGYIVRELYTDPPDLEAKLREAREVIQFMLEQCEERGMSGAGYEKAQEFLERTK